MKLQQFLNGSGIRDIKSFRILKYFKLFNRNFNSFSHYVQVFKNRNERSNREYVRNLHQKSISGDTSCHRPTIEIRTSPPFEIQRYFNGHYRLGRLISFFPFFFKFRSWALTEPDIASKPDFLFTVRMVNTTSVFTPKGFDF